MFDISGNGIGESELVAMLSKSMGNQMSLKQLQTVSFCTSCVNLHPNMKVLRICAALGSIETDVKRWLWQVVRSTIREHDQDCDGRLNYDEFKRLISQDDVNMNMLP